MPSPWKYLTHEVDEGWMNDSVLFWTQTFQNVCHDILVHYFVFVMASQAYTQLKRSSPDFNSICCLYSVQSWLFCCLCNEKKVSLKDRLWKKYAFSCFKHKAVLCVTTSKANESQNNNWWILVYTVCCWFLHRGCVSGVHATWEPLP